MLRLPSLGTLLAMSRRELAALVVLQRMAPDVVPRELLVDMVGVSPSRARHLVMGLRRLLGRGCVQTVYGQGYRWRGE